jgi:hypothetical protein
MEHNEMMDIHKIIRRTLKVVPKAWDMNHKHLNSDCHMELTDKTYELVGNKFNTDIEGGKKVVDNYFMITCGQI